MKIKNPEKGSSLLKIEEERYQYQRERTKTLNVDLHPSRLASPPLNSNLRQSNHNGESGHNLLLRSNVYQKNEGVLHRSKPPLEEGRSRV